MVYKKTIQPESKHKPMRTLQVYLRTEQPAITSWVEKQSTIHMARQTRPEKKIHQENNPRMKQIQEKWIQTWGKTNQEIENAEKNPQKNKQTDTCQSKPLICKITKRENELLKEQIRQQKNPKTTRTTRKRIAKITKIMLQAKEPKEEGRNNKHQNTHDLHQCPTCEYKGEKEQHLEKHRQQKKQCQPKWKEEQTQKWTCPKTECKQQLIGKKKYKNT